MELSQLNYFVQVARFESVSRAAEALHVSQPALSKSIARLEEELGVVLFDRVGRKLVLNEHGRSYQAAVEGILRDLGEANALVRDDGELKGSVSVGVFGPQGEALECMSAFMQVHPKVHLTFDARYQSAPSRITRTFDLVFYPQGPSFEGFAGLPYSRASLRLCVPRDHPFANAGRASLADFSQDSFIFMNTNTGTYEQALQMCLAAGFTPRVRAVTSSGAAQMKFIQDGLGVGLVDAMRHGVARRGTAFVELEGVTSEQVQCLAARPLRMLSVSGAALLDHALSYFGIDRELAAETFEGN